MTIPITEKVVYCLEKKKFNLKTENDSVVRDVDRRYYQNNGRVT